MPWIENISKAAIASGYHYDAGNKGVLIQIGDPCTEFPTPKFTFESIYQFEFLDAEDEDNNEFAITPFQAETLVGILRKSLADNRNIVVHCVAGICRSGAVAEVGVMLGFDDTESFRIPNLRVKRLMLEVLNNNEEYK